MQTAKCYFQPNSLVYPIHSHPTTDLNNIHRPSYPDTLIRSVSFLLSELNKFGPIFKLLLMIFPGPNLPFFLSASVHLPLKVLVSTTSSIKLSLTLPA